MGPLVLGHRLSSSFSQGAFRSIIYKKGAVVIQMLAHQLGEEVFLETLAAIVQAVDFRSISTADFLRLLEQGSGRELDAFAHHFIYGTGLPEFYYDYQIEPAEGGGWEVAGQIRRNAPFHYEYRVVESPDGKLEVLRDRTVQSGPEEDDLTLVVPVQANVLDPKLEYKKKQRYGRVVDPMEVGNSSVTSQFQLAGVTTSFVFNLDHEPKNLWFDRDRTVFARFFDQRRFPKKTLYYKGLHAAARGRQKEAIELFQQSLTAEILAVSHRSKPSIKREEDSLDARVNLSLARLHLEMGRFRETVGFLARVRDAVSGPERERFLGTLYLLEARLALDAGDAKKAHKLLRRSRRKGRISTVEHLLLKSIAARELRKDDEAREAAEAAAGLGADAQVLLAALDSPIP